MIEPLLALVLSLPPVPQASDVIEQVQQDLQPSQVEALRSPEPLPEPEPTQSPVPQAEPSPEPTTAPPRWAIPVHVVMCESGGNYKAQNPRSSAAGAYQLIQSTANGAARSIGHPELVGVSAHLWPPLLQDKAAAWLWSGGAGKSHWKACL